MNWKRKFILCEWKWAIVSISLPSTTSEAQSTITRAYHICWEWEDMVFNKEDVDWNQPTTINIFEKREFTLIGVKTFRHLCRCATAPLRGGVFVQKGRSYCRIDFEIGEGMTCGSKRNIFETQELMFVGWDGVKVLTSMMGQYAVLGLCRQRPKLTDRPCPLRANDAVHYILQDDDPSCKFEFTEGTGRLVVEFSFKPYFASFNVDGKPIHCPNKHVWKAVMRELNITST